jgi:hypothetical protein
MVRLWDQWRGSIERQGAMLEGGGLLDQPAIMVEAFDVMDRAKAELDSQS